MSDKDTSPPRPIPEYDSTVPASVFADLDKIPNPRIQEQAFISNFLPFMLELDPPEDAIIAHNTRWIKVARTPFNFVDVFRGEEYLFTVPPLYNSTGATLSSNGKSYLQELLRDARQISANVPIQADLLLRQHLEQMAPEDQHVQEEYLRMWIKIYDFYNLKDKLINLGVGNKDNGTTASNSDIFDEYEDA